MSESDADAGETVQRLLAEADEQLAEADAPEELLGDDDLQSLADEARSFFEDAGTAELLDAVGVDTSGSSEPRDLLPALAEADDESVVRFRRLKLLSGLEGDEEDRSALEQFEALGAVLDEEAEADVDLLDGEGIDLEGIDVLGDDSDEADVDEAESETDVDEAEETEEEAEAEAETETADTEEESEQEAEAAEKEDEGEPSETEGESGVAEAEEETETAEEDASASAEADEEDGGIAEHAGALKGALEEIKERVQDESDRDAPAERTGVTEDDEAEEEEEADDEEGDTSSGSATGPPSDRPDMRVPARFSTMPDK